MSIATEITRIQAARNKIRDKLIELGLATSTTKIDALATAVDGIENKGAISASVQEGDTYTIPKGYHNGSGTVSGVAGGGNYSLQSKSVTPTKQQQSVTPDQGFYGLSDVTIKPIPEAYQNVSGVTAGADDVLANKIIVDATGDAVAGTMPNNGAANKTLDTSTGNQSYTIPKGYHNGSGNVSVVPETKTATPTRASQDITPSPGKVLSKVTVGAIPEEFADISGVTASEKNVLGGYSFVDADGVLTEGTMDNHGESGGSILSVNKPQHTIPEGYHNGYGVCSITLEEKSVTPAKAEQVVTPSSLKVLSKVTVSAIPNKYGDVSDATGVAADVLTGKIVYGKNAATGAAVKLTGTMKDNGAISEMIDGLAVTSYTIPKGYHSGSGTVSLTNDIETALAAI